MKMVISKADVHALCDGPGLVTDRTAEKLRARGVEVTSDNEIVGKWMIGYNKLSGGWEICIGSKSK